MARSLKNMMGVGIGALTGRMINGITFDGLTATGTGQGDALQLTGDVNVVSIVNANAGVVLPPIPQPGDEIIVTNLGANALNVYPSPGGAIHNGGANVPFALPSGQSASFIARPGSVNWIVLASAGSVGAGGVAPTLSSPTATTTGPTAASLGVTTDQSGGTLYWIVCTSGTPPSKAQIAAGQDSSGATAAAQGSQTVSASGVQSASASGLTVSTTYYAYFMHTNGSSQQSNVAAASSFTTTGLATPTVTNVSALGATPLVLALSDGDYVAGKYLQWEIAASLTPAKNGDGSYTTTAQKGVTFIDGDSWARLDLALGYNTPGGAFAFHCRVLQEDASGAVSVTDQLGNTFNADASSWSTDYADTISVTTTTLDSSKRNTNNAIIGTSTFGANLKLTGVAQGAPQSAGTTQQVPVGGKYYNEVTITALNAGGYVALGVADGTFVWATSFTTAANQGKGAGLDANAFIYPSTAHSISAEAAADILQMCVKRTGSTTGIVWIGKNNTWANGDPSAETGGDAFTLNDTNCWGYVSVNRDVDQADCNFGQAAFTYTKPTGSTAWS